MSYPFICYYYLLLLDVDLQSGGGSNISEKVKFICCFEGTLWSWGKNCFWICGFKWITSNSRMQWQNSANVLGLIRPSTCENAAMHVRSLPSHDVSEESNLYDSESWIMMNSLQHR